MLEVYYCKCEQNTENELKFGNLNILMLNSISTKHKNKHGSLYIILTAAYFHAHYAGYKRTFATLNC